MKIGVIVGRFQTSIIHDGYLQLFKEVRENSDQVVIFIGSVEKPPSRMNPLPFEARKSLLIRAGFVGEVLPLHDANGDLKWSQRLDGILEGLYPGHDIILYGSRDSGCCQHYKGRYPTKVVETKDAFSSTLNREVIGMIRWDQLRSLESAAIWTTQRQYNKVYPTVDCAIWDQGMLLLIRKRDENLWRFPGGFVDPKDTSLEHTVRREVREECGDIEVTDPVYVGSRLVDDWRYKGESDKIMTSLFVAQKMFGVPKAGDDAKECLLFNPQGLALVPEHKPLIEMLQAYHERKRTSKI
jgi:bifunctional NMN adenylyltransferase/nudix hydrolase